MNKMIRSVSWLGVTLSALSTGCCTNCDVDRFASIPCGAIPDPPHVTVRRHFETQAGKAEADDFVFYRHEFYLDGKELGPYGQYHMRLVANRLNQVPFPVLIQAVPDARLNEQRRQTVIAGLKKAGYEDVEPRVLVGFPEAEGLSGEEAERVYNSLPQAGTGVNGYGVPYRNNNLGNSNFNSGFYGNSRNGLFRSPFGFSNY